MSIKTKKGLSVNTTPYEFKYMPKSFEEMIVSEELKPVLKKALDELPNMILSGPPGTGKGTFVDVLRSTHPDIDILKINCSDYTSIDDVRDKVKPFATSIGFGALKIVFLNEVDYLSHNGQAMLRDLIEQTQKYTRFILACNYPHKIMDEMFSRCQHVELNNPPAVDVVKRCWSILDQEGVKYNKKTVVEMVKSIWQKKPDVRNTLVTLRMNVIDGVLRDNFVLSASEETYKEILDGLYKGELDKIRAILKSNPIDYTSLYMFICDILFNDDEKFKNAGVAIELVGEHDYRDNMVANREINFISMCVKMMRGGAV